MQPSKLICWGGIILLCGFAGCFLWKFLRGGISLRYLLSTDRIDRSSRSGYSTATSPARTQLLIVTIIAASYYLIQLIHEPTKFPELPTSWLVALAGSHSIYLGGKAESMLFGIRDLIRRTSL